MKIQLLLCMVLASIAHVSAGNDFEAGGETSTIALQEVESPAPANEDGRIIGGADTTIIEFPHQCSMRFASSNNHYCGCSILSSKFIMTAAHCVKGIMPTQINIVTGSTHLNTGGTLHNVEDIVVHEDYSRDTLKNDIAVVKVKKDIDLSTAEREAVALPTPGVELPDNARLNATGWGRTVDGANWLPNTLQVVELDHINRHACLRDWHNQWITTDMICAKDCDKSACNGDSGGPLGRTENSKKGRFVQYGVVSFGSSAGCTKLPGVYTRVSSYIKWILENADFP